MKALSTIRKLIAATLLLWLMGSAHALTVLDYNGNMRDQAHIRGSVTYVDQNKRCFKLHWSGVSKKLGSHSFSWEQTFRVTDGTVYQNGSWADMKKGIRVRITGQSDVVDTVRFAKKPGSPIPSNASRSSGG